ncbi:unnamed protein product [Lactuca saligna]|uniref:Uncharacterized protein n=1 Tax=Lactuca saligna TaxID=75948 RepID=A0AA36E1S9_LACSI|nr:unnamed protein product [Lactuca saligna]
MYYIFSGINLDYKTVLWAQMVQSNLSTTRHNGISCAHFWTLVVQRAMDRFNIPVMEGSSMAAIQIFRTTNIILVDISRFTFTGSIPETMLCNVPVTSEVVQTYRSLPVSGLRPIIDVVYKAVMKSCNADVNALLSDIIETCDYLITITVKKHLAEKLRPVFAMLNRIEGILKSDTLLKQGRDTVKQSTKETTKPTDTTVKPKLENELKVNVASGSKGKEKLINDSEEDEPDEHEMK